MTLRARIGVGAAAAAAIAVIAAALGTYAAASATLNGEVDDALRRAAGAIGDQQQPYGPRPGRFGGAGVFAELVDATGQVGGLRPGADLIPAPPIAIQAARGGRGGFATLTTAGITVRVYTVALPGGFAVLFARPLTEVNASLADLRRQLLLVASLGVGLAALLGIVVGERGARPVRRLAREVDHVAVTQDLDHRIDVRGNDETAQLAGNFNRLLEGLGQARQAQETLVADASHELRTPLTAVRTNVEMLAMEGVLDAAERRHLAADLAIQLDRFSRLVADLVQLARGDRPVQAPQPLRLDELAADAVARARAYTPGVEITLETEPITVQGDRDQVERAIDNLLDNAVKYAASPEPITVTVANSSVQVRDHGPGVPAAIRERIFARFYRGEEARDVAGSGLGLAIVAQIAAAHGGGVEVRDAPANDGSVFVLRFP